MVDVYFDELPQTGHHSVGGLLHVLGQKEPFGLDDGVFERESLVSRLRLGSPCP